MDFVVQQMLLNVEPHVRHAVQKVMFEIKGLMIFVDEGYGSRRKCFQESIHQGSSASSGKVVGKEWLLQLKDSLRPVTDWHAVFLLIFFE